MVAAISWATTRLMLSASWKMQTGTRSLARSQASSKMGPSIPATHGYLSTCAGSVLGEPRAE